MPRKKALVMVIKVNVYFEFEFRIEKKIRFIF